MMKDREKYGVMEISIASYCIMATTREDICYMCSLHLTLSLGSIVG